MRRYVSFGLMVSIALVACNKQPSEPQQDTSNKPRKHVVVQFTDAVLTPETAQVLEGGDVVWVNMATLYTGSVVFPQSIRESFTCGELRPLFMETAEGYQSIPIRKDAGEEVHLPCPLKPGEYTYTLYLFSAMPGEPEEHMDNPQLTMPGKIVVE